tara:strand:- start:662 stop:1930 length:1269 start_codon:yes stop_codon:yes gene_type:complete
MNKILAVFFLSLIFCNIASAESYYFKECKLSAELDADYILDFKKNVIKIQLETKEGSYQEFEDKIELIEKNKIVSEKIKSGKSEGAYFVYYLDVESESVIKQNYKKEPGLGLIRPDGPKQQSFCQNVNAGWDKKKIKEAELSETEKKILKTREQILKEQRTTFVCKGNDINQWTDCKGKFVDNEGIKFAGKFKNGKISEGTATYPGGAEYVGKFINNKPEGQGTFTFSDGSNHFGEWKNGKANGSGIKTWKDGREYAGEFKNDQLHGAGTLTYPDGSKYVGNFIDGKRHGEGTLTYSSGKTYIGKFVAGYEHGEGTCFNEDGSAISCTMDIGVTSGKETYDISLEARKWVKVNEYESTSGKGKKIIDLLESNFKIKALEFCASTGNYKTLEKKVEVLELDETPAFGIEPKVLLGINGVVECI